MITATRAVVVVAGALLVFGAQYYGDLSARAAADARIRTLENEIQTMRDADAARMSELAMELNLVQNRIGVTAMDAQRAAKVARDEQVKAASALRKSLDQNAQAVVELRHESGVRFNEVRQEATSQIGAVTGEVGRVAGEVTDVRKDISSTRTDLASSRREIGEIRDALGSQIARNADELSALRRRGERDYFEFDIRKTKEMARVADIRVQLTKADAKARKYDVTLQVDDNKVQKKGQLVNEPVQLIVGRNHLRYELVVNFIDKDRIRGYVSTPKKGTLASEGPVALQ